MSSLRFDDGAAYEQMMGVWSRLVGEVFLDWVKPAQGLRWIDVGCGNGAFTELIVSRCAPSGVEGIDPSEAQLAFARTRPGARGAAFAQGDAMALPFASGSFDAAVMALVLVFVPDPAQGVAELVRVVGPGGMVATYMWDMLDGGFPLDPIIAEMRAMGLSPTRPPCMEASRLEALRELWSGAGLTEIEMREITPDPARTREPVPSPPRRNSPRQTAAPLRRPAQTRLRAPPAASAQKRAAPRTDRCRAP
jgi:SAM-dependent methyltransferase